MLLDRLAANGILRHVRHSPKPGKAPLASAYRKARRDPMLQKADRVMSMDADEFLVVHIGNGTVQDLVQHIGDSGLGTAIFWKTFGDNGVKTWEDTFVRNQFTRAAASDDFPNNHFKSIFRDLTRFKRMASHSPGGFTEDWGGKNIWTDANGDPIKSIRLTDPLQRSRAVARRRVRHDIAQVNHYAIKSQEVFDAKRLRKSGARLIYRHNDEYFETYNKNDVEDMSALSREAAFAAAYADITADPEIVRLHHACCAHYVRQLCTAKEVDPHTDARFLSHREQAGEAYIENPAS